MRKLSALIAALVLALGLIGCGTDEEPSSASEDDFTSIELKLATMVPETNSFSHTIQWWADELESRSGGAVTVDIAYSGSLLAGPDIMPGVRDRVADLGLLAGAYHPAEFPLFNAGTLPFLTDNPVAAAAANAHMYEDNEQARAEFDALGVRPLLWLPASATVLGTKSPVDSLDDLEDLRIRSVGWMSQALEAAGANPVAIDSGEMYESIQRGVLDGAASVTFDVYPDFKLPEVAPYVTDTGLGVFNAVALIANEQMLEGLSDATLDLIEEVSAEANESQAARFLEAAEDAACTAIRDTEGTVALLPESDRDAWSSKVTGPIQEAWVESVSSSSLSSEDAVTYLEELRAQIEGADEDYETGFERCAGS